MDGFELVSWLEQHSAMIAILAGVGLLVLLGGLLTTNEGNTSAKKEKDSVGVLKKVAKKIKPTAQENEDVLAAKKPKPKSMQGLIVMHVVAKDVNQPFKGYPLVQAFAQNHLHASEQHHFQRFSKSNGKGKLWFHVASMRHPGVFDLEDPGMMSCPGLVLILDCKQVDDAEVAFDCMMETAHKLAADLDARLLDEEKHPLSSATTRRWRDEVATYCTEDVVDAV